MHLFLAYKFTGESYEELEKHIPNLCRWIKASGNTCFCSFALQEHFKQKRFTKRDILYYIFNEIEKADVILVFINSTEKSEGMLLEIGYSIAQRKSFWLLIRKGIKTNFLKDIADELIEYVEVNDIMTPL